MNLLAKLVLKFLRSDGILRNKLYSLTFRVMRLDDKASLDFLQHLKDHLSEKQTRMLSGESNDLKFTPDDADKYRWLQDRGIRTVLDVGAWEGDSAMQFHKLFPQAVIHSFEPLPGCFEKLSALKQTISGLRTYNFGLGSRNENVTIHKSSFSPSSSILPMAELHKKSFPFSAAETTETIEIRTLDSVLPFLDPIVSPVLLKIDVQGYEENVLKGAETILEKVKVIIVEMSFANLYKGQPKFCDIYNFISERGFVYSGSWSQLLNPTDGAILQQNGIFIRAQNED